MSELADRHRKDPMLDSFERIAHASRSAKLDGMPLTIIE